MPIILPPIRRLSRLFLLAACVTGVHAVIDQSALAQSIPAQSIPDQPTADPSAPARSAPAQTRQSSAAHGRRTTSTQHQAVPPSERLREMPSQKKEQVAPVPEAPVRPGSAPKS